MVEEKNENSEQSEFQLSGNMWGWRWSWISLGLIVIVGIISLFRPALDDTDVFIEETEKRDSVEVVQPK